MTVTLGSHPDGSSESLSLDSNALAAAAAAHLTLGTYNASTGALTITGSASQAVYQEILEGLVYNNTSDDPNTTDRTVSVVVNDGSLNSTATTTTIHISAVDDAPTASIGGTSFNATEGSALTLVQHNQPFGSISDVDADANDTMTVTLSVGEGTLHVDRGNSGIASNGISGNDTGSVTITGTQTQINNLLEGIDTGTNSAGTVTYTDANHNPSASTTLTLTVSDNGHTGSGGPLSGSDTATINITAVDDAPVNAVPGAQSTPADTALVFGSTHGNAISISDVDAGSGSETVTLSVQHGALDLATTAGLTVGGDGTGTVTLTGDLAHLNAALDGLTYHGAAHYTGGDTLTITTNDLGNTGIGGPAGDSDQVAITILSHPPVAHDDSVVTNVPTQSGPDQIVIPDWALLANDTDQDGDKISITAIPTDSDGTASHSGSAVTFLEGSNSDSDGGTFTYTGTTLGTSPQQSDNASVTVDRDQAGHSTLTGTDNGEILLGRDNASDTINGGGGNDVLLGGNSNNAHDAVTFSVTADGANSSSNADYLQFHFDGGNSSDHIKSITLNLSGGAVFDSSSGQSHGDGQWGPSISGLEGLQSGDVNVPSASSLDGKSSMTVMFDSGTFGVGDGFDVNIDVDNLGSNSNGGAFASSGVTATITLEDGRTETVTFGAVDSDTSKASFSLDAPVDDVLNGGQGDDILWGGTGADTLTGGDGADHFRYNAPNEGGVAGDHITDFTSGTDIIDILGSAFGNLAPANSLTSTQFGSDNTDNFKPGEILHFDTANNTLYYNNAGAAVALAHLDNGHQIAATDIHVV
jgi:hypothetical protein